MYSNQAFSSGPYADMLSGNPLLPHNYSETVGGQNELKFMTSMRDTMTVQSIDGNGAPTAGQDSFSNAGDSHSHLVPRTTQLGLVDSEQNVQNQGLSLSLGSVMPSIASVPTFPYQYPGAGFSSLMTASVPNLKGTSSLKDDEASLQRELRNAECMASLASSGFHRREGLLYTPQHPSMCLGEGQDGSLGFSSSVLSPQYLKAAQELLDEIVNVRKALKQTGLEKQRSFRDIGLDGSKDSDGKSTSQSGQISSCPNSSAANSSCELSPAERQNLLDKKTKLLTMLDEVDKRYRQYCHQMQIVVSSFDMVAGCGAAEPYTALALSTISRHFRCLRDAISGQIQVTQRSLGEQEGIPRLRYVDQQLRQQKALQQLGVMRQAWRPQRGLPETSVSILRAWLFEHFLHPYPKDSEKIMLARQTGLTRNQVANWFINARVRLWKPMVEEIYKEEFGDSEMSSNILSSENTLKAPRDDAQSPDSKREESQDNIITVDDSDIQHHGLKLDHASELDRGIRGSDHGENGLDPRIGRLQGDQRFNINNSNSSYYGEGCIIASAPATYDLSELGNIGVGGQVSLALELRNCDSEGFGGSNDDMLRRRKKPLASSSEADLIDYHFTDQEKQQSKFGNPHLLHEFVV
ncbi:BEL1-like homeodomain protein 7 isoform X1 [Vigna umbellata]|uniref:BEL1-like homeodomain protein 7 isoform X1 n=1 Tax=Vigna umbellata TaxID=87088 RepID=UPI001F5F61A6|nr:BEL1-like homeodomain protein 7 isoform X1 [Vigna umbellata]XP_047168885.1 BEL1-like homeodomain protein 7 isoform X1 [Vigna umbellata]XP_047168887.1 BEL1-like homeodomain protein 7 isoform X1 [Vigna umbellata]